MKNKMLKVGIAMLLLITLTMANFLFVGVGLYSYAVNNIATNNQNVEFDAYFKDGNGNKATLLETDLKNEQSLFLQINVKKEGYLNGSVTLENSNFTLKSSDSQYVNRIEGNTIYLNQINAGVSAEIEIKVKPEKAEIFKASLLTMSSELRIDAIYRDSQEKDIRIDTTREVVISALDTNTEENIENSVRTVTNKIVTINGEEKRLVQLEVSLGLKNNIYPIKRIVSEIAIPEINGEKPSIVELVGFNTMTSYDYKYDGQTATITFENNENPEGYILWKTQGTEKVILSCIYNKEADTTKAEITANGKVTLYNDKEIGTTIKTEVESVETDSIIQIESSYEESSIYKGKIKAGIDREIIENTMLSVSLANVVDSLEIQESEKSALSIRYNSTSLKKEEFDNIFGETGVITIKDETEAVLATIDNSTPMDEAGNIVINYGESNPHVLKFETTKPITEGKLNLRHSKIIDETNTVNVNTIEAIDTQVTTTYNSNVKIENTSNPKVELQETNTYAKLEVNKDTLSTVIANNVEMKAILIGNSESYDLYRNPRIEITLPEEVENIEINSIDLVYENELKIQEYHINGKTIVIQLEGAQTQYKESAVEGANIVINATFNLNRKVATKDTQITMTYTNQNATSYIENATSAKAIRIVAPKDMTTLYSIEEFELETIGQEESIGVMLKKGSEARVITEKIEVINNNENSVEDVKIIGTFATKSSNNNIDITIVEGLNPSKDAKVYYSENENATDDLQNVENQWQETISNNTSVKKYLIVVPILETQESIEATYKTQIPENLEYNQNSTEGYTVNYINTATQVASTLNSTNIELQTGIGPKIETTLSARLGGANLSNNATIRSGEVILYNVQISNTGTEDIQNLTVSANIPEGATLVEPEEHYEYTGASYYKELESKTFEKTIESLKVGEVTTISYEVRVNVGTNAGTILRSTAEVKYGEAVQETNEIVNVTDTADIRVTVKRVTDRSVDLYESGTVQYFAIIENISNQTQNDVKIRTNLSNNATIERLMKFTGMTRQEFSDNALIPITQASEVVETTSQIQETVDSQITSEIIDYTEEINVGSINAGENVVLGYNLVINKNQVNTNKIDFYVRAINGSDEYKSNVIEDDVANFDVDISMSTNTESRYIQAGDTIIYTINIKNNSTSRTAGLVIKDEIPSALSIQKVTADGQELSDIEINKLEISAEIAANETGTIVIETIVNYSEGRTEAEPITNLATAEIYGEQVASTSEINHIILANENSDEEDGNNDENNDVDDGDIATGTSTIEGLAWLDANGNGIRDAEESPMSNITVRLLNAETNNLVEDEDGEEITARTNTNGIYVLDHIGNGRYIAIFEYDTTRYTLTRYQAEGIENSKVMRNELTIEGETQQIASTDIISIENDNISDINIGLIEVQNFDLKLDKVVSKILIQNASGSTVREYNDATMAKLELDARQINGTTVIIEYSIKVSNIGDVEGYARSIVDYMPSDLKFSSELNKEWYQLGDSLYTSSLANERIAAGETKTLTLTLTKTMTEDNTGLINNTAEIAESYNELGLEDSNSVAGNRTSGENDMGSADLIISIRTGGAVYITIAIIAVLIVAGAVIFVIKRKQKTGEI